VSVRSPSLVSVAVHQLTRAEARRIAVRAQLLTLPRPTDLLDTVRHLTLVQDDVTEAVARSAELVLWSRLGSTAYAAGEVEDAEAEGSLVFLHGFLRPAEDIALFTAEMAAWPGSGEHADWQEAQAGWLEANDDCRRDVLEMLRQDGPLPTSALPDTTLVPWQSSGWNNDRNVRMLVQLLVSRGEVAAAPREGRERKVDLAERIYPDDPPVPVEQAERVRDERRLRALGVARPQAAKTPNEPNHVGEAGEPATIEGVTGAWRVDPAYLDGAPFEGRTALLSPLDRLVMDRKRTEQVFGFDYQLEMYKPAAQRRWGYWAMPILHGDRLVGKLDATADRRAGVLHVDAVHEDEPFTPEVTAAVRAEIEDLAGWLGLDLSLPR